MNYLKKSKLITLLLVAALSLPFLVSAQKRGGDKMEKMKVDLNLSDQQAVEIKVIHDDFRKKMKENKQEGEVDKMAFRSLKEQKDQAILKVLTEEQGILFKKRKEERKMKKEEHRQKGKAVKTELKAYRQQNIEPVMARKRSELEAQLSEKDRSEIAALRLEIKNLKKERKAVSKKRTKPDRQSTLQKENIDKHARASLGAKRKRAKKTCFDAHPALKERALVLVNKWDKELSLIEQDLAPMKEKWAADKKQILAKHLEPDMLQKIDQKKASRDGKAKSDCKRIGFLLMEPGV